METREIKIIYGKTGTGKSYLAKNLISEYERSIIIDPKAEYEKGIIFNTFLDLTDYHKKNNPSTFCYICRFESDIEHEYLFLLCLLIENLCLLVEEAEIYINPRSESTNFLKLCRYGRHHNISIIGIARRNAELSINFRSLVTHLISFKQTEPSDLLKMKELGFEGLDKLENHNYIEIIP